MPIGNKRIHQLNLEISELREQLAEDLALVNPGPLRRRQAKNISHRLWELQQEKRRHDPRYASLG